MVHHVTGKRRPDIAMDHVAYYSRCWATSSHGLGGTAWQSDTAASYYSSFLAPFTQHSCTRRTKRVDCNDSGSPVPDLQGPAFLQHLHAGEGSAGSAVATTQATDNGLTKIADRQPSVTLPPCTVPRTRFPRLRGLSPSERTRRSSGQAWQKDAVTTETKKPRGRSEARAFLHRPGPVPMPTASASSDPKP